jgi:hypothetical protein
LLAILDGTGWFELRPFFAVAERNDNNGVGNGPATSHVNAERLRANRHLSRRTSVEHHAFLAAEATISFRSRHQIRQVAVADRTSFRREKDHGRLCNDADGGSLSLNVIVW